MRFLMEVCFNEQTIYAKAEQEILKKRVCAFGVESMMQWIQELIKRMNDVKKTNRS